MSDIISVIDKMNTTEVAQDKPDSEFLWSKAGANINALIDKRNLSSTVFTSSGTWVAPDNIYSVLVFGVGSGAGGGEGGNSTIMSQAPSGGAGGTSQFNGDTVGGAPGPGEGAYQSFAGGGGRGGSNGCTGGYGGGQGGGGVYINGIEYGKGGAGGGPEGLGAGTAAGGGGGGGGFRGWKTFAVVPGNSYSVTIHSAGAGGGVGTGAGAAGSTGAIIVFYGGQ